MPRRLVWAHERVCLTLVRLRRCRWGSDCAVSTTTTDDGLPPGCSDKGGATRLSILVATIGKNDEMRKAMGQPPGWYFVDVFALNQVAIDNQSENMHQVFVGQLVRDLTGIRSLLATRWCCAAPPVQVVIRAGCGRRPSRVSGTYVEHLSRVSGHLRLDPRRPNGASSGASMSVMLRSI